MKVKGEISCKTQFLQEMNRTRIAYQFDVPVFHLAELEESIRTDRYGRKRPRMSSLGITGANSD